MKTLLIPLSIGLAVCTLMFTSGTFAQESKPKTAQQQKFADCSHKSKGLKAEERKKFMRVCLKGKAVDKKNKAGNDNNKPGNDTDEAMAASDSLQSCSEDADSRNLEGEDRDWFISECLRDDE